MWKDSLSCSSSAVPPFSSIATRRLTSATLHGVTHLLVSVPPDTAGDPVLTMHGADIAAMPKSFPGSGICRPPGSTAIAAAAGSMRPL